MTQDSSFNDRVVESLARAHAGGPAADDQAFGEGITSVEQAYAIQERLYAGLVGAPGVPRYWKSGGPTRSDPMRHAPLPPAGVRPSGAGVEGLHLRNRWVEAEVALRLGCDVAPAGAQALTEEEAGKLVDGMAVSIEIVDTRWAGGRSAPPLLKLADLVVHGALVLGEFMPFSPRDWAQQECRVRIGTADWQVFRGSLGIVDPAWVLPHWLRHVTRNGKTVPAGTVVSTGTWCGLLDAAVGDRVTAELPGIGAVNVQF